MKGLIYCLILFISLGLTGYSAIGQTVFRGTVLDEQTKTGVAGASVIGGKTGVQTDSLGRFSIEVQPGATLTVSHVNYRAATHVVGQNESDIIIYLIQGTSTMDDVVVQGFTKRSRSLATGSTTIITADDIKDVPAASAAEILQGRVAGVNIQNTSGMPGARGAIFQRGLSNLNVTGEGNNAYLASAQPLFIIDGVPIDPNQDTEFGFDQAGVGVNPLSLIPTEDIESIEILKDAASTSVYGSRGAYGVWIINTKRGRTAVPKVSYDGKLFYTTVPKLREVYGGRFERAIKVDQIINNNIENSATWGQATVNSIYFLSDSLNPYINNATDWQSYFYNPQVNHSHNLRFSGGTNQFNYKVNLNYYDEQGIIKNTGLTKYSGGMNAQYRNKEKFTLMAAINASNQMSRRGSGVGLLQTGVARSGMASTLLPPPNIYTENNDALAAFNLTDNNKINNVSSNLDMSFEIIRGLKFFTKGSMNFTTETYNIFYPSWLNSGRTQYNSYGRNANTYDNLNRLQYTTSLKEDHTFLAYVFSDLSVRNSKTNFSTLLSTPNDFISGPFGYDLVRSNYGVMGEPQDIRQFGYGGSFQYDYMQKYVFTGSYRLDGTSVNGPATGFNQNPMLSVRWNLHKEKFMDKIDWLDYSSLRASWGRTIVPQGSVFDVHGRYYPSGSYLGRPTVLLDFNRMANIYYQPSSTTMTTAAYEGGFFKGRLNIVYEYYYKVVENIARNVSLPREIGYNEFPSNDISMVNWGHEITLNVRPLSPKSKLNWMMTLTGAFNKNILTKLPGDAREIVVNQYDILSLPLLYRLGRSSLSNYLFNTKGVYASDADVPLDPTTGMPMRINNIYLQGGDPIFADLNGDYVINDLDRVAVGDPMPKVTGGFINSFKYQQFTLDINTSFTLWRDVLNTPLAYRFQQFYNPEASNLSTVRAVPPINEFDYWRATGDNAKYPNPYTYAHNSAINSFRYNQTLFQEDGSYLKINSIIVGYSLRPETTKKLKMDNVRIFVSGANLAVLSNYSGPNPENVTDLGRDNPDGYPNPRKYTVGITATF